MNVWIGQSVLALVASAGMGLAWQQPDGPPPPRPGGERNVEDRDGAPPERPGGRGTRRDGMPDMVDIDPQEMRARLERRLDDARMFVGRLESAIAVLDDDGGIDAAMAALRGGDPVLDDARRRELVDRLREGRGERGPRRPVEADERERLRELIAQELPELDAHLRGLPEADAGVRDRVLGMLAPRLREVLETRRTDPTLASLKLDEIRTGLAVIHVGRQVREAQRDGSLDASSDLREQATAAIREQGAARLAVKAHELEQLRGRISQLEQELAAERDGLDMWTDALVERMLRRR